MRRRTVRRGGCRGGHASLSATAQLWSQLLSLRQGTEILTTPLARTMAAGRRRGGWASVCLVAIALLTRTATDGTVGGASGDQEVLRRQAIEAITHGDHITALGRFREAMRSRDWETGLVRVQYAQVLDALGQHEQALSEYTRVVTSGLTGQGTMLVAAGAHRVKTCLPLHPVK